MTFQEEHVKDCWDELYPMAQAHWASTANYRRHEPFCPDKARYLAYNEMGFFRLLTARDGTRLAGYLGLYVTTSMHSGKTMCVEDTFYIDPAYRGGRTAMKFLFHMEHCLKEWGIEDPLFSCEVDNNSGIHRLLTRLGYRPVITQYSKRLSPTIGADSPANVAEESTYATPRPA